MFGLAVFRLCSLTELNWAERLHRRLYTVSVVAALMARVRPDVQVVDVGQSATFLCVVSGSPTPSVAWFKDGTEVTADNDHMTMTDDRRQLTVRRVLRKDAGIYQCLVENSDEGRQSSGRLIIGGRSILSYIIHRWYINMGCSKNIFCSCTCCLDFRVAC